MNNMTVNPPAIVDEDALVVRRTIQIAAPPEKVWSAVTEPEHISRWFGQTVLEGTGAGAAGSMTFEGYGTVPLRVEAMDAPHSITYRWGNDDALGAPPAELDPATSTEFTFTLEPLPGGTRLTVVETGFERTSKPLENTRSHGTGWTDELDKLVRLLESEGSAAG